MDILNVSELRVLKVEGNELDYLITAECKEQPTQTSFGNSNTPAVEDDMLF